MVEWGFNPESIGAIASIVGSLGVVATMVALWLQVRDSKGRIIENTKQLEESNKSRKVCKRLCNLR